MRRLREIIEWSLAAVIVAVVVYVLLWGAFMLPFYLKLYISGG